MWASERAVLARYAASQELSNSPDPNVGTSVSYEPSEEAPT